MGVNFARPLGSACTNKARIWHVCLRTTQRLQAAAAARDLNGSMFPSKLTEPVQAWLRNQPEIADNRKRREGGLHRDMHESLSNPIRSLDFTG